MTLAISAHEFVRSRDCDAVACEEDGTVRPNGRILCDLHARAARRTNGAPREAAANGHVPTLELDDEPLDVLVAVIEPAGDHGLVDERVGVPEGVEAPEPDDALAGRVCCWSGCSEPAAGVWGKGVICAGHRAELNARVSAGKKRAHERKRALVDEPDDAPEDVGELEAEDVVEPKDALVGARCSWQECEAPAVGGWGRGFLCAEHRAEMNRRISEAKLAKSRPERRAPGPDDEQAAVVPLEPVARRLVPTARRVDHAVRAHREALQRVAAAGQELEAAREGWRSLLAEVGAV